MTTALPYELTAVGMEMVFNPRYGLRALANTAPPAYLPLTALWPDPLPNGTQSVAYSYTLTALGGIPPYTFTIASGTLPTGLSLNASTGLISGTPTVSVSMDAISFTVTDSA